MKTQHEAMMDASLRRFVKVAPPTIQSGIGNALREAFDLNGESKMPKLFEDLIARLD